MAWTSIGSAGTAVGSTSADQSSATFIVGASGIASGAVSVLFVACDNYYENNLAEAVTGIADTAGNVWVKAIEFTQGSVSPQGGCTISVWYSLIRSALVSTDTIVASLSNSSSRDATVIGCWSYSISSGYTVKVFSTDTLATHLAPAIGLLNVTTPNSEFLRIRATALEIGGDPSGLAIAPTSSWTELVEGWAGAQDASGMYLHAEGLISTGTGADSDPDQGGDTIDCASAYIAFLEVPPLTAWHRSLNEPPPPPPRLETGSQQFYLPPNQPIFRRSKAIDGSHDGTPLLHGLHDKTSQIAIKVNS